MMRIGQLAGVLGFLSVLHALGIGSGAAAAEGDLPPLNERFSSAGTEEVPDFQRHVMPLLGRLGCNGRACHGSFQGQGGFRLSLFGYDFQADHDALLAAQDEMRVDVASPEDSLILVKPTDELEHEGGLRYEKGGWEYHVLRSWIEAEAPFDEGHIHGLVRLEVTPPEILLDRSGQTRRLKAVAVWEDGSREDVTPLCRFQTNDEQFASIDQDGRVTAGEPGDTHVVVFYDNGVVPVPVIQPVSDLAGKGYPKVAAPTKVDKLVVQKLRKLGIVPAELCTDAEFLRRVSLDITGSLPTPEEVEAFLADASRDKRDRKIDELLERPAYAAWWTTRLCDMTGNNEDALRNALPIRGRASKDWYDWIYRRVADNVPYDELVAGIVLARSRREGQSYTDYAKEMSDLYRDDGGTYADQEDMPHYWSRRDFRQPDERAIGFAHAFMGVRIQCAQCHKHPFDQWSKKDFEQFSTFFTGVVATNQGPDKDSREAYQKILSDLGLDKMRGGDLRRALPKMLEKGKTIPFPEVTVRTPRLKPGQAKNKNKKQPAAVTARVLGGELIDLTAYEDARQPLMDWLRDPQNQYFARAWVNRVWSGYFNVGIVNPPDDLSLANPPSNAPLLEYLTQGFIGSGYDMKWLHREITRSRTYQRSWRPNETNRRDTTNFSRAVPRRLPAEVVYDAIWQATASDQQLAAAQDDVQGRAIAIPGAGIRYANTRQGPGYALTVFGRSTRDSNCDCDRTMEPSLMQTVFLQNDQDMFAMLDRRKEGWLDQVAGQYGLQTVARGPVAKKPADYNQRVAALQRNIQRLRKAGDQQKARLVVKKLRQFQQRFGAAPAAKETTRELSDDQIDTLVRDAYLRSLSRHPHADELARGRQFIRESEMPMEGIRGLLWALLNTKEFIVNH